MKNKQVSKGLPEGYEPFKCIFPSSLYGVWSSTNRILKVMLSMGGFETG